MYRILALGMALLAGAGSARAADQCPPSNICASDPQGIVNTLQVLGYRAQLGKSETTGNPKIESAESGYTFTIYFYGCEKGINCTSLNFLSTFEKNAKYTPAFVNFWNKTNRFSQLALEDDGALAISYDLSTVGGVNQINFSDVADWWQLTLGNLRTYLNKDADK